MGRRGGAGMAAHGRTPRVPPAARGKWVRCGIAAAIAKARCEGTSHTWQLATSCCHRALLREFCVMNSLIMGTLRE